MYGLGSGRGLEEAGMLAVLGAVRAGGRGFECMSSPGRDFAVPSVEHLQQTSEAAAAGRADRQLA